MHQPFTITTYHHNILKLFPNLGKEINAFYGRCKECQHIEEFLGIDTKDFPEGLVFLFDVLVVDTQDLEQEQTMYKSTHVAKDNLKIMILKYKMGKILSDNRKPN